jgi:hypothetical protein
LRDAILGEGTQESLQIRTLVAECEQLLRSHATPERSGCTPKLFINR